MPAPGPSKTPKALLFDLDGTLVETDSLHRPAWADILAPHGYQVDWPFYESHLSGRLNPDIVAEFLPNLSGEEGSALIESKERDFRSRVDTLEPLPGLKAFIERAQSLGMRLALVTNAPRQNARAVIEALGLAGVFDPMILAEDAAAGKPDPEPYNLALKSLDLAPREAVAFEDSKSGISSATGAGIPTIGVASTHAPETLRESGAFAVVRDFTDSGLASRLFG